VPYLGIIESEIKVGAIVLGMALNASHRDGHESITLAGIVHMSFAGAVT